MSSFIVSAKHFNSVEKNIVDVLHSDPYFSLNYTLRHIAPFSFQKGHFGRHYIENEIQEIFETVRELQITAVCLRYRDDETPIDVQIGAERHELNKTTETIKLSLLGLYNALKCIEYQIETEHITELRPLTQAEENAMEFIIQFRRDLALVIIANLPDEDNKIWIID